MNSVRLPLIVCLLIFYFQLEAQRVVSVDRQNRTRSHTHHQQVEKSEEEWKKELTEDQFKVLCGGGTEKPFTGKYLYNKREGIYKCAACKNPLFSSETKYDSGSGWPSFYNKISPKAVKEKPDHSHGMKRIEIVCSGCGGHLGHVFEDGPNPTGLRYCVNSVSLEFEEEVEE